MSIDLTPAEREYARKFIATRERLVRQWRRNRWVVLVLGLVLLGAAAFSCVMDVQATRDALTFGEAKDHGREPAVTAFELDFKLIYVIMARRSEVNALFIGSVGIFLLLHVLYHWNRHVENAILVKLLRAHLEAAPEGSSSEKTTIG